MILGHSSLDQRIDEQRGIPNWRETGLQVERRQTPPVELYSVVDFQILDFSQRLYDQWIICIIPQTLKRHDGVRHSRIDRTKPTRSLEVFQHPGGSLVQ